VTVGGKAIPQVTSVKLLREENGRAIFEIASGSYEFEATDYHVSRGE
jgi:hypothetical protein